MYSCSFKQRKYGIKYKKQQPVNTVSDAHSIYVAAFSSYQAIDAIGLTLLG